MSHDKLIVEDNRKIPKDHKEKKHYKGIFHIANEVNKDGIAVDLNDGMMSVTFPKN
jgi:HSP20 family molecular chaperone IbpA